MPRYRYPPGHPFADDDHSSRDRGGGGGDDSWLGSSPGNIDESEDETNSIARPPLPPPPTKIRPDAVCLSGECERLDNSIEYKGHWGMTPAHITNPGLLSNAFTYALLDSTHKEDIYSCQRVPTSGKYSGNFLYDEQRTEIPDELDLQFIENSTGTYNVHGSGLTKAFGLVKISGIFDCGKLTINKFDPSLVPSPPTPAPSCPTPRRTTKRRRTSSVRLVGYTASGDLIEDDEDDEDEVDEDVLDEYDLESGSAEDEVDEDVLDEYEYESDLESGSAPATATNGFTDIYCAQLRLPPYEARDIDEETPQDEWLVSDHEARELCMEREIQEMKNELNALLRDTTYLYGQIAIEISSGRVIFSGEEWTPDEDSTQGYPFYYSASQLESGTFTGSFCHSTNEVITDELSIELERNDDGTSQVHGSGNNRFGSFVVSGKCDGVEMILYRTYTHVEEDTTEDEPQPLFSKGESFVNMKPKCSNSDCNHNHGVVSPSESSEGVVDDEVDEDANEMLPEESLKFLQGKFQQQPRFQPSRRTEEPKDWEETSGITREALEKGRRETKKILDDIIDRHPFVEDLVNYFLPMIELAVPSDKIYLVLLHCALQWARNHVTSNCGGNCAMGNPKDLKDSTCCTLRVIRAFSKYLKDHGDPAFYMGHFADALGCINGRQGFCRTLNRLFQRCAALDEKDQPEVVVEVLTAVLDHFDKFKIPTFVFSLAGKSTEVNDKILDKIKKSDYDAVTVCPVKVYHAQYFDVPSPATAEDVDYADTCLRTSKTMTGSTSEISECLEGHFNKCVHSTHSLSLFEHACEHSDLPMVQKNPTKEMFEGMTTSIKRDKDTNKVRAYCMKYPDQPVSKAHPVVQEYATRNWIEIHMRRQEYYEQKRSPLLPPESIEDVSFTCRYLLSNMGTNSSLVQQNRDGSKEATSARMSPMASKPRPNKRKRDTSKSIKLAKKKKEEVKCSVLDCGKPVYMRKMCRGHYLKDLKKRNEEAGKQMKCSVLDCGKPVYIRKMCSGHYQKDLKKRNEEAGKQMKCSVLDCGKPVHRRGMCDPHYQKDLKKRNEEAGKQMKCSVLDCGKPVYRRKMCSGHYQKDLRRKRNETKKKEEY